MNLNVKWHQNPSVLRFPTRSSMSSYVMYWLQEMCLKSPSLRKVVQLLWKFSILDKYVVLLLGHVGRLSGIPFTCHSFWLYCMSDTLEWLFPWPGRLLVLRWSDEKLCRSQNSLTKTEGKMVSSEEYAFWVLSLLSCFVLRVAGTQQCHAHLAHGLFCLVSVQWALTVQQLRSQGMLSAYIQSLPAILLRCIWLKSWGALSRLPVQLLVCVPPSCRQPRGPGSR